MGKLTPYHMNQKDFAEKISELILSFNSKCQFVVIIHDDETDEVTQFGYGCRRCMANILEQAAINDSQVPHNDEKNEVH